MVVAVDAPSMQYHALKFVHTFRVPTGAAAPMPSSFPSTSSYGNTGGPPTSAGHGRSQADTFTDDAPVTTRVCTCDGLFTESAVMVAFAATVSSPDLPCFVATSAVLAFSSATTSTILSCVGLHS